MRTSLSTVVVAAIVLVGCSGSVSPAPSSLASSQGPSIVPTASSPPAKPSPTATPTAQPTVEPTVAALAWGEPTTTDGDVPELEGGFDAGPGAFVSVYQAAIAFSSDGIHWQNVDSPIADVEADYLSAVAIGPTGLVAVGEEGIVGAGNETVGSDALVMFSADGLSWQRISDPAFKDGEMQFVGATNEGFVAFGSDFSRRPVIWTSPDGREWLRATNETGLAVARGVRLLIPEDGRLTALVGPPRTIDEPDTTELEVWQTEGRAEWQRVGRLPDRVGPALQGAAGGGRLLVMDRQSTWTSTDGRAWERGANPTIEGTAGITAIAAYPGGFIAVGESGSRPDDTCSGNVPWVGHTWTSADGREWHEQAHLERAAMYQLVVLDGRIVGLGRAATNGFSPVVWSADLPAALGPSPTPTPTPSPTPAPSPQGCGG